MQYTAESESPESYHTWTGLSVLASAVRRNVWLDQGIYKLYPNLYVILTGPAGEVSKSTTIRLGRKILRGVPQVKMGQDSVTMEELVRQLEAAGKDSTFSALTLHSTELSDLIDSSGIKMVSFLTSIYDGDDKWDRGTKGSTSEFINKPLLNLLAGTTPDWIADGLPVQAIGHGFVSRTIFVYEDKPRFLNPFPSNPDKELVRAIINDLNHIALLKGQFVWEGETENDWGPAKTLYDKMYRDIATTRPPDYRLKTYYSRKKNHLLKVAMLLSVAENDSLVLRPVDLETAWDILKTTESRMAKAFSAVGKYEHASDLERILFEIQESGGMTQQAIHEANYAAGDMDSLDKILKMLVSMGRIQRQKDDDGTIWYTPA